jgi:hypothetical protein
VDDRASPDRRLHLQLRVIRRLAAEAMAIRHRPVASKPCVRRMDSVLPFGLPASIRHASRWSKDIAMPAP